MTVVPWNLVCAGLSLACAAATATMGMTGRMPRYVTAPLTMACLACATLWLVFAGAGLSWVFSVYLETWPISVMALADAAALYFLLALWAGAGDAHWFLRLAVTFGALALLTVIEMIEPLLMLTAGMLPVMMAGLWWKRLQKGARNGADKVLEAGQKRRWSWRIRLQSVFLAFVIAGLVAVILRSVVHATLFVEWSGLAAEAMVFAGLGLATVAVVIAPGHWRLALVPLWCIASWAVICWHNVMLSDWTGWIHVIDIPVRSLESAGLLILGWITFSAIVGGIVWLALATKRAANGSLERRIGQTVQVVVLVAAIAPVARVYWGLIPPATPSNDLNLAGEPGADESSTVEQLVRKDWGLRWAWEARPTDRFDATLLVVAEMLKTPDRIWVNPELYERRRLAGEEDQEVRTLDLLYYHFDRALWIAASEGKDDRVHEYSEAQRRIIELLETSNLPEHVSLASTLHFHFMHNCLFLHEHFSHDELHSLLEESEAFLARQRSSMQQYAARRSFQRRCETWRTRLASVLVELATGRMPASSFVPNAAEMQRGDDDSRMFQESLRTQLALQLYRAQHQQFPEQLDELMPSLLSRLPVDSHSSQSGQTILYRRTSDGYVLYSRGVDRIDNGGNFPRQYEDPNKPGYDNDLRVNAEGYGTALPWLKLKPAKARTGTP